MSELVVVVAIVGLISLVAVPNFMGMYRSSRMKTAVRNFTGRLRSAQMLAISSSARVKVKFNLNSSNYTVFGEQSDLTTGVRTWSQKGSYKLEESGSGATPVTFTDTNFPDFDADGSNAVVFDPNGTLDPDTRPNVPTIDVHTTDTVSKPTYKITITVTGSIKVT